MKVDVWSSEDGHPVRDGDFLIALDLPPTPSPSLKALFQQRFHGRGVHQMYPFGNKVKSTKGKNTPHWYALRTTYGREKKHTTF